MGAVTGVPLAMGLGMITDGTITKKRVFAPEGAIDPMEFIRRYSRHWMSPGGGRRIAGRVGRGAGLGASLAAGAMP